MQQSFWVLTLAVLITKVGFANCVVFNSNETPATPKADVLYHLLTNEKTCAQNVVEFKGIIKSRGLSDSVSMVANRGRNNPELGSFSFFEEVTGDALGFSLSNGQFFFGHFTDVVSGEIVLDQTPGRRKLLIELIVWDFSKQLYNFYELISLNGSAKWFYRGDSADALADNQYLHRDPPTGTAKFGSRMRCSGCHSSGGPIMKELTAPHNDWWTETRPLVFAPNVLSVQVKSWMRDLEDAKNLADGVKIGIQNLHKSETYRKNLANLSLQEQLRPLFCTVEINIESDRQPLVGSNNQMLVPSAFFINPLLASNAVTFGKSSYVQLLNANNMKFPETPNQDADHGWLTPVKGFSDLAAIEKLIENGTIDGEFAADVLAVDFQNPLLSAKRCRLLKSIPQSKTDWLPQFISKLKENPAAEARSLLAHLTQSELSATVHRQKAETYVHQRHDDESAFKHLLQLRSGIFKDEISTNPMGQILEPGFRLIFPVPQR